MRLTYRDSTVPHTNAKGELWEAYSDANYNEVINKLAAYEDTGLEPEEIKLNMDGLDEYRKAEVEGRLVRLPCKVGDMVYYKRGRDILGDTVERIVVDGIDNQIILNAHRTFLFCDLGRNVFLTYEAAEAALKGEREDV